MQQHVRTYNARPTSQPFEAWVVTSIGTATATRMEGDASSKLQSGRDSLMLFDGRVAFRRTSTAKPQQRHGETTKSPPKQWMAQLGSPGSIYFTKCTRAERFFTTLEEGLPCCCCPCSNSSACGVCCELWVDVSA